MKVRMQAGRPAAGAGGAGGARALSSSALPGAAGAGTLSSLQRGLAEVGSLYKGVVSAATGAGIIIGTYFAFYSTTKRFLREKTSMGDGQVAFVSGATAAVGSSVVKVPIAVCIRSVQAGVYGNVFQAARAIKSAAGVQGLFTGFLPTLLEDVPDMAVKFAAYETLRAVHMQLNGGRQPSTAEDLLMGGTAGAAAAAATTPLDVVKTRMMTTASSRPTIASAVSGILAEGSGPRAFMRGMGPRALSNGINSAVFFCFFEAIRRVLIAKQADQQKAQDGAAAAAVVPPPALKPVWQEPVAAPPALRPLQPLPQHELAASNSGRRQQGGGGGGGRLACLSLAMPLDDMHWW